MLEDAQMIVVLKATMLVDRIIVTCTDYDMNHEYDYDNTENRYFILYTVFAKFVENKSESIPSIQK